MKMHLLWKKWLQPKDSLKFSTEKNPHFKQNFCRGGVEIFFKNPSNFKKFFSLGFFQFFNFFKRGGGENLSISPSYLKKFWLLRWLKCDSKSSKVVQKLKN